MQRERILNKGLVKRYLREELDSFRKVEITEEDSSLLQRLYNTSGLTILGLLDTDENLTEFIKFINKYSKPKENIPIYTITGKLMNDIYNLQGQKAYPEDLKIIAISLADVEDIDPELFRKRYEISNSGWFDDIVEDNKMEINYGEESDNNSLVNESFKTKIKLRR